MWDTRTVSRKSHRKNLIHSLLDRPHFPKDLRSSETADLFMALIMYRLKEGGRAAVILPDGFLFGTDGAKLTIKSRLLQSFNLHTVVRLPATVFAPYTSITTNILFFDRTGKTRETWFYRLDNFPNAGNSSSNSNSRCLYGAFICPPLNSISGIKINTNCDMNSLTTGLSLWMFVGFSTR